jgi:hypothetical protein
MTAGLGSHRLMCVIYYSPYPTIVDNGLTYNGPSVAIIDKASPRVV